uniref:Uncharacterized protein n=1 Tax=Opuntia streptacantha TaxID=393608 RepID=A0A7C9DVA7_OPUST
MMTFSSDKFLFLLVLPNRERLTKFRIIRGLPLIIALYYYHEASLTAEKIALSLAVYNFYVNLCPNRHHLHNQILSFSSSFFHEFQNLTTSEKSLIIIIANFRL